MSRCRRSWIATRSARAAIQRARYFTTASQAHDRELDPRGARPSRGRYGSLGVENASRYGARPLPLAAHAHHRYRWTMGASSESTGTYGTSPCSARLSRSRAGGRVRPRGARRTDDRGRGLVECAQIQPKRLLHSRSYIRPRHLCTLECIKLSKFPVGNDPAQVSAAAVLSCLARRGMAPRA